MISGFDPSYNPETLERAKAESKELDPQQQEMADRWAAAMESSGVETATAQAAAETAVAGDEVAAAEIVAEGEPNIAETEPQIQQAIEDRVAQEAQNAAIDAVADATVSAAVAPVAGPIAAEAASNIVSNGIQHFAEDGGDSSFDPLPPEKQRAMSQEQAQRIVQATKPDEASLTPISDEERHDSDNLVAQAVTEGSGVGTINLNDVGAKLEGDGVRIKEEVDAMDADIAEDLAVAGGTGIESTAAQSQAADSLAVDAGAKALALKEQAADVAAAVEQGDTDADAKVAEFTQAASDLETLTGKAESAATMIGQEVSETIGEARAMTDEAKDAVDQAQTEAAAAEEEKDEEEGEDGDENSAFSSDKYPELAGLDNGDRKSIFM